MAIPATISALLNRRDLLQRERRLLGGVADLMRQEAGTNDDDALKSVLVMLKTRYDEAGEELATLDAMEVVPRGSSRPSRRKPKKS